MFTKVACTMELPLLSLLLVLLVALIAGRISSRIGFPSVLGELIAGILLGPPILGLLSGHPALEVLANLGIILMMLYIGMEIDPAEMKKASLGGFLAAIGGFITPFILCYLLVVGTGGTHLAGMFVGMAAGVTSLATKSRILSDLRLLDTRIAHVMMAGALIADTLSLILFAGIVGLADAGSLQVGTLGIALGKAIAFFVIAGLVGRFAIPWIGRQLVDAGRGSAFAVILVITLVFAEGAHLAGMHGILGAFLAGLFLRDSVLGKTLQHEVMDLVRDASVRFLAPIFFVTAGFAVSLDVVTESPGLLLAVVGLASVGKVVGTALFYLPTGHGWREGIVLGASMNGRGAVEIIIAQIGLSMGLISTEIFSILVFMAIATTATVPIFLKLGVDWLRRRGELVRTDSERKGTLIVGAGPLARTLATSLGTDRVHLIDRNAEHCDAAREAGLAVTQGDALDERVLSEAGASHVHSLVALTGNPEIDALSASMARKTFLVPDILLPAYGSETEAHRSSLRHLGASTLFGGPINALAWEYRIEQGAVEQVVETLSDGTRGERIAQTLEAVGSMLPLSRLTDGGSEPIASGLSLAAGDRAVLLRLKAAPAASDLAEELIRSAPVIDLEGVVDFPTFLEIAAGALAPQTELAAADLASWTAEREHASSTVIERGIAVPHVRLPGSDTVALALVRSREGIEFPGDDVPVHAAFVLATSEDRRSEHLRLLAAIARIAAGDAFMGAWLSASGTDELTALSLSRLRNRD